MDQGREGFERVIRHFAHVGHVGKSGAVYQMNGVTIGWSFGSRIRPNRCAGTRLVVKHDGLPQQFFSLAPHNSGPLICTAACRVGHDQSDWLFRIWTRPRAAHATQTSCTNAGPLNPFSSAAHGYPLYLIDHARPKEV